MARPGGESGNNTGHHKSRKKAPPKYIDRTYWVDKINGRRFDILPTHAPTLTRDYSVRQEHVINPAWRKWNQKRKETGTSTGHRSPDRISGSKRGRPGSPDARDRNAGTRKLGGKNSGTSASSGSRSASAKGSGKGSGGGGGGGGFSGGGGASGKAVSNVLGSFGVSPKKLAKAMTDAQYGPVIAELKRAQDMGSRQHAQNLVDLSNWAASVHGQATKSRDANVKTTQDTRASFANAAQGIAAAFGGEANVGSAQAGKEATNTLGLLSSLGSAQTGFDNDAIAIYDQQAADAKLRETRSSDQSLAAIAAQLASTQAQKGNAYTTNLSQAHTLALQRMAQLQNMQLAQSQFGLDQIMAENTLANSAVQRKATKAQIGQKDKEPWAPTAAHLRSEMASSLLGEHGFLRTNPGAALQMTGSLLSQFGYSSRKGKSKSWQRNKTFRDEWVREQLTKAHANGMYGNWKIDGKGRLTHNGRSVGYTFS